MKDTFHTGAVKQTVNQKVRNQSAHDQSPPQQDKCKGLPQTNTLSYFGSPFLLRK
jgi:hypothetical protein